MSKYNREYKKKYDSEHRKEINAYQRKYYQEHPAHRAAAKECALRYHQEHREECLVYSKIHGARRRIALKLSILTHYGDGECACVKCGFNDIRALSIDHINGGGTAHRKIVGSGDRIYAWLVRNDYPQGFQTLCMNCQFVKRTEDRKQQIF